MNRIKLLTAGPKQILMVGRIQKYFVAGEQKSIVRVVTTDKDKRSQKYAGETFWNSVKELLKGN